ncbi:tRNA-specific 2-thiouridylase [Zychaea mexicana]|uniref:tRNA-specific 2-thiouridylase n=1 Tax=Zychaea mexicana TaxID=64656 RepID=UPI0022FDB5C4|nr:tRNA-specific 2-thiouridylase [Zychaea mexicana]KAI9489644.1 tRNA-specific 2-thiouridylase [Zychaea mexicana]
MHRLLLQTQKLQQQQQRRCLFTANTLNTTTKTTSNNNNGPKPGDRVMVAMSGGVDSSVTAALLKDQGFQVQGIYMRNWDTSDERGECTSVQDWQDVQRVCEKLNIQDCRHVNFVKEYWTDVFQQTLDDYAHGLTPNPDIACNRHIKFGALLAHVPDDTWLATGHYCRSLFQQQDHHRHQLWRGRDRKKDQSYFLASVDARAIQRTLFPLGEFESKAKVKAIAHQLDLHVAKKRESMGICFVGQRRRFADFLKEYIDQPPGPAVDVCTGKRIGDHRGLFAYTVGQASKICYGSDKWFVAQKRMSDNTLLCVPGSDHPALFHSACTARDWVWIEGRPPPHFLFSSGNNNNNDNNNNNTDHHQHQDGQGSVLVDAQVRYRMAAQKARLSRLQDGRYHLEFLEPIRAMAPGQQVVIYLGDWCLGGGTIQDIYNNTHSPVSIV